MKTRGCIRTVVAIFGALAMLVGPSGCDSDGAKSQVSSGVFFAPQPAEGEQVEVLVEKLDVLRLINPDKLDSQLRLEDAETRVLGKLRDQRQQVASYIIRDARGNPVEIVPNAVVETTTYAIFERNSGSLFEFALAKAFDSRGNQVDEQRELTLSISRIQLASIFTTTKAQLSATSVIDFDRNMSRDLELNPTFDKRNWIFGFESSERSLFVIRLVERVGNRFELEVRVLANIRTIQRELREQAINFIRTQVIGTRVNEPAGRVAEILTMASPPGGAGGIEGIQDLHLFVITSTNGQIRGGFRVFDRQGTPYFGFNDGAPINPKPIIPDNAQIPFRDEFGNDVEFLGLVNYDRLRSLTGIADIDIFDFQPAPVRDPAFPDLEVAQPRFFLLFEKNSATFILVEIIRELDSTFPAFGEIIGSRVARFTRSGEIDSAIRRGGAVLAGSEVTFTSAFFHPDRPDVLAFEEESNTMMSLGYSDLNDDFLINLNLGLGTRAGIFSPNANLLARRDMLGPIDADLTPEEPSFVMSTADVSANRLLFDQGSDDILSINYTTGLYVVVLKQADIGRATQSPGVSDLTFIEPINPNEILVMDSRASDFLRVRVDYRAFPRRIQRSGR